MKEPLFSPQKYLDAFIKIAQAFATLTTKQDVWSEIVKMMTNLFDANLAGFAERRTDGDIIGHHWALTVGVSHESILTAETKEVINGVLEDEFLATHQIYIPEQYSIAILPIKQENLTTAVMLIGHRMSESLSKELLDVYLAVSGLVGTAIAKLTTEEELRRELTERKQTEERARQERQNLEYLSRTALEFAAFPPEEDIYEHIAERLREIAGDSIVIVGSFDESSGILQLRSVAGLGKFNSAVLKLMGRSPIGMCFSLLEEQDRQFRTGKLIKIDKGMYELAQGQISERACMAMQKLVGIEDIYSLGIAREGTLFATATMLARTGTELKNATTIETFANQASIALQRRRAEEVLKEYSERLEKMVEERTQELLDVQEQLIRREKLAMLGQWAGGVGHELRNPLGAIKNAAYFLKMVIEEPEPEVKEMLEILEKEVAASDRIISSLLDFARPKPLIQQEVNIDDIVIEALSHVTVPENVEIVRQLDETLPAISADFDKLGIVFGNFIRNAIQAMPDGGKLSVKSEMPSPEWVAVSFTDTGVGIPEENRSKLFEPLFTTKSKGIGLGLAIIKNLVEQHGGTIEVESEIGKGSTFTVRLPMDREEEGREKNV